MEANYLKLNDSKTEFVIFGTQIDLAKVSGWTVTVGNSEILPSKSARNIGAFMDSALNMETHINNIIRSCSGAYTEIVIRGGPGVEVEVNLVIAEGASCYRPMVVWGHGPPGKIFKYLSQMVHYKSILKVIWEQNIDYCCSKILHSCTHLSI